MKRATKKSIGINWRLVFCCALSILFFYKAAIAQENIPLGTWRQHISYTKIIDVAFANTEVYAVAENGVMVFNKTDQSITTLTKIKGLSGSGITSIAYDAATKSILISYADGTLDIIRDNKITNFLRLKLATGIGGSKKINHILVNQNR